MFLLAMTKLSADGSFAAWFLDRVVPSLVSGLILLVVGWWLNKAFKAHVDATTISQTEEIKRQVEEQTRELRAQVDQQTAELKSSRRRTASRTKMPPAP